MREIVVRVRHNGPEYTATLRQVAAGALLDTPSAPGTVDSHYTAQTAIASIVGAVASAHIPVIPADKLKPPPARPTHGGFPTVDPPDGPPCPQAARMDARRPAEYQGLSDSEALRQAFTDAAITVAMLVGMEHPDGGVAVPPSVDVDRIPATVLSLGRRAFELLGVAAAELDPEGKLTTLDITAEDALSAWARRQDGV